MIESGWASLPANVMFWGFALILGEPSWVSLREGRFGSSSSTKVLFGPVFSPELG